MAKNRIRRASRHQSSSTLRQSISEKFLFRASWIADYPDAENYIPICKNFSRMGQTIPILK
jgi:hypothetical protein